MSSSPRFIHLRVHTEYSLLEGAVRLKKLPGLCEKMEMPAVAVTDTNSMFSALEFAVTASGAGVQPIMGCQVDLTYVQAQPGEKPKTPAPLVLLAQSETGYENLMKLSTCLYVDKGGQLPQVTLEELADRSDGLICLSGGPDGPADTVVKGLSGRQGGAIEKRAMAFALEAERQAFGEVTLLTGVGDEDLHA